jgi:hypothetical protein
MTEADAEAMETTAAYRAGGGSPVDDGDHVGAIGARLRTILALEWELVAAETRRRLRSLALALGLLGVGLIVALASLVVLAGGGLALALAVEWRPLALAGGGALLLGLVALGWGRARLKRVWRLAEVGRSLEETLRWLGAQLRYRLRFG